MPDFTATVITTVVVVVAGAEVTRLANIKYNTEHPGLTPAARRKVPTVMAPVIGGFALGLFLFAAGIASEYLASLLCLLLILSSLLINGQNLFTALNPAK
jgi:hypothetical protein